MFITALKIVLIYGLIGLVSALALIITSKKCLYPLLKREDDFYKEPSFYMNGIEEEKVE